MVSQLTTFQLQAMLAAAAPAPFLLDVRESWELDICRIEGVRHVPMRQIPAELSDGVLSELDRAEPIVVICHHGIRSQQVALYLDRQGFSAVLNLQGGVDAWAREVDPAMAAY